VCGALDACGSAQRMTAMRRWPIAIVAGFLLAACAHGSSRSGIAALPGSAKNADEFRSDDALCRQAAAIEAKATEKWRYDMTYLQCMYAKGNQVPNLRAHLCVAGFVAAGGGTRSYYWSRERAPEVALQPPNHVQGWREPRDLPRCRLTVLEEIVPL
jgi:hypothetical protein